MEYTPKLGEVAKDRITGFEGTITGIVYYVTGCNQALLQPPIDSDGKMRESYWFDWQRLEFVRSDQVAQSLDNTKTPGADRPAPKR